MALLPRPLQTHLLLGHLCTFGRTALCLPYNVRPLLTMYFSKWLLHVAWPLAVSQAREVHGTYMAAQAC